MSGVLQSPWASNQAIASRRSGSARRSPAIAPAWAQQSPPRTSSRSPRDGRRDHLRLARQERGDLGAVLRPRVRVGLPARVDRDVAVIADLETAVTQLREQPEPPQVRRRLRHPDVALIGSSPPSAVGTPTTAIRSVTTGA